VVSLEGEEVGASAAAGAMAVVVVVVEMDVGLRVCHA